MDKKLIIDQGNNLYRYKGVISVKGMDQRFVFQGVHMLLVVTSQNHGRKMKREKVDLYLLVNI